MFVRTFVIPFYYGSGTVISYGSGSGSEFLTSCGSDSGSTRQKVTVHTVPVPVQHDCYDIDPYPHFKRIRYSFFYVDFVILSGPGFS
jgi:hypothetical protein